MSKYILITGGELFNKGAQSMTFVAVDEIKKRFPDSKIILLSSADYRRKVSEKKQYNFEILPFDSSIIFQLVGGIYKVIWNLKTNKNSRTKYEYLLPVFKNILVNTAAIIDISGYALSSQFGSKRSLAYLAKIMLAKKYNINMYMMPQSYGPFSYGDLEKIVNRYYIKRYMQYPELIFAREEEGYKLLKNDYGLTNVKKSNDLVLMNKSINLLNVYKKVPEGNTFFDNIKGVAIVPNMKNFKHGNIDQIMSLYDSIIKLLLKENKTVYLIRHSFEDIQACKMIKERYIDNNNVILISDDMSCLVFDELVQRFDFIIGSRFHSIVHAYKNSIPCISLGWATKYHELLKSFKQEDYIFDVRNNLNVDAVEYAIKKMLGQRNYESDNIRSILTEVQTRNVFDVLESNIRA
ncbi:polysaccharide pyruvyl transferase family protein [Alteribacillus sp. JSM 102045]|uniref:polysaccharide pyruvyl transferase family protein n=1 Tax=Alteribacillus sp. JSM 102045 TaxID=1562101 RepID=UPI0035C037B8